MTVALLIATAVVLELMLQKSHNNQGTLIEHLGPTFSFFVEMSPISGFSAGPLNKFGATQFVKVRPILYPHDTPPCC